MLAQFKEMVVPYFEAVAPSYFKKRWFSKIDTTTWKDLKKQKIIEAELKIVSLLVDKDSVCLDIGSHIGQYIYALQKTVNPAHIHAFEPNKRNYKRLKCFFPDTPIYNMALSDKIGETHLSIPIIRGKAYETRGSIENVEGEGVQGSYSLTIQTTTLEQFVIDKKLSKVDFIKIDVEGHELKVIDGGRKVLEQYKPLLIIEIEQRHHERSMQSIFDEMKTIGYDAFFISLTEGRLLSVSEFSAEKNQHPSNAKTVRYTHNFIFVNTLKSTAFEKKINDYLAKQY